MKQFRLEQSEKQKEDAKPALKQYLNELDSDKSIMEEGSPPSDKELLKVVGYLRQMGIMR